VPDSPRSPRPRWRRPRALLALAALLAALPAAAPASEATLVLTGARVWTGEPERPWAAAVAIAGERLIAVGTTDEALARRGPGTRVLDLPGRFVVPGFIDDHTHFDRAGALILGVNLLDVADEAGLARRLREARDRLPPGAPLVGGDWGAYEAWALGSAGGAAAEAARPAFLPHRSMVDPLTPENPVLLARWDRSLYLANSRALKSAGAACDWPGVECDAAGAPTGRLGPEAARRVEAVLPPKTLEQRLAEGRAALAQLASFGVTGIHDITTPEQMGAYQELRRRGELTTRVYARPTLDRVEHLTALGIGPGFGDEWLRLGGLKGFVDGIMGNSTARFYAPYRTSGARGSWRPMMEPEGNMERLLRLADAAGFSPQVHAIGDEAIDTLLDLYERVLTTAPPRERRWRLIHAQVLQGPEVAARMARLGVVAEVQPYHAIDDMRWMEERIGERARWAYAFKTLRDAGVRLLFGSDWPGTNASWYPADPMLGIYAAVTRQTLEGEPEAGWFPEERVDLETALRAYTVNNAWAAGEEADKGTLAAGKLADLAVLERDPFAVSPAALKDVKVVLTVVGGRVVYERR
jgi:predicted amidohydrolase YtcJ